MDFSNVYDDPERAAAYASMEFPGTYFLAYRDLPAIHREHARGRRALDFGCGAGRSTRFLKSLGFDAVGVDVSADMVRLARERDPAGDYRVIADGDFASLPAGGFDLVQSVFTFDNVPGRDHKVALFAGLRGLLAGSGRLVNLVSSPDIYVNEWASFTTREFPENRDARSGEPVRIVMKDVEDRRPVVDVIWYDEDYTELFADSGLVLLAQHRPLGRPEEPIAWLSETTIAPWSISVLGRPDQAGRAIPGFSSRAL